MNRSQFIAYLIKRQLLTEEQQTILATVSSEEDLCCYLVKNAWISADLLTKTLSSDFNLPIKEIDKQITELEKKYRALICQHTAIPLQAEDTIFLVLADPNNSNAITAFEQALHQPIEPSLGYADQINSKIRALENHKIEHYNDAIRFIDELIKQAIREKASDIHLEPIEHELRVRFRIDGLLQLVKRIHHLQKNNIINRLKIMANLDISEQRLPQDGQISLNEHLSCRISTCPTLNGEKIVLRLLQKTKAPTIKELGMNDLQYQQFLTAIEQPQGLILVTGPTGSGKTITLYSALSYLNNIHKNICTVEDPVEIPLDGINQMNVKHKIGLDFAAVLKHLLRQDPDIIMVGEIRDSESAKIAIRAAQTGHLVLATLHANSAQETLTRLKYMGISTDLIAYSLNLILAQRLLRKICLVCSGTGCQQCHDGYSGRTAIFEMIPFTDALKQKCLQEDLIKPEYSLQDSANTLLQQQIIDVAEIKRVLNQ